MRKSHARATIAATILSLLLCALGVAAAWAQPATTRATTQPTAPKLKPATRPIPQIRRVLLISVDGLRPDLLSRAYTPNIHGLMNAGTFTLWARTTAVAITLPSHMSMLTGVTPQRHGIGWNSELPLAKPFYPKGRTLFDLARAHGYTTAMIAGKSKFEIFARPEALDWCWVPAKPATTRSKTAPAEEQEEEWPDDAKKAKKENLADAVVAEHAVRVLREHQPDVTFVHFPHVDNVGHISGWGTPEQIEAVEEADAAVGMVLRAMDDVALTDSTLVILTADHGGAGRGHGADDARSRHIPWIAVGPGVRRGFDLTRYADLTVDTEDTFATACYVLGLVPSPRIDGKPLRQIRQQDQLLQAAN